ncbi:hypothetical protein Q1695_007420 [Nippostrongylus brasiliensis]|nr:hypothetical protein Q1695_007420 [Nippostrongylus brasiliensis]
MLINYCEVGRILACARECYPSCNSTSVCPQVENCTSVTCQCPPGKVESDAGDCIYPIQCAVGVRLQRQADPILLNSPPKAQVCLELTLWTDCGTNQRRYQCGVPCEPTCANPYPTCASRCVPNVCQCLAGYIRYAGVCITKLACPNPRPATNYPTLVVYPTYPSQTIYPQYPPYPSYPPYAPYQSYQPYSPPTRYLTTYIPPYQPNYGQQLTYRTCPPYEQYVQCVPCEQVCNSQLYLCYNQCVDSCTCAYGLVRDTNTNACVPSNYCQQSMVQSPQQQYIYSNGGDIANNRNYGWAPPGGTFSMPTG